MAVEGSWVERLYTHFVGRDLTYVFGGGVLLGVATYALRGEHFLPQRMSLELVAFLVGSYFLGLGISEFSDLVGLVRKVPRLPDGYSHEFLLRHAILQNYGADVLISYERTVVLMHVGAGVGTSSFWAAAFMGVVAVGRLIVQGRGPSDVHTYVALACGLAVYGSFMILHSRSKSTQMESELSVLAAGIQREEREEDGPHGTSAETR